tara:strand:- start:4820 stop:6325 length:1506 start_codon:yes stop_codon:yes gene_type:complete
MADTAPAPKYRLSANTLNNMKEAAGNYMPNYGNWRFKVKPPKLEPEPEPEPEPTPSPDPEPDPSPDPEPDPTLTGEDSRSWGSGPEDPTVVKGDGGQSYRASYDAMSDAERAKKGTFEEYVVKANKYWEEHPQEYQDYLRKKNGYTTGGKDDDSGGAHRTYDIVNGKKVNIKETVYGDQTLYTPLTEDSPVLKRSPYKALGDNGAMGGAMGGTVSGEVNEEVVEEVPQVDPYEELMFAASNFRGATPGHHDQIKKIVGEMKTSFSNGDKQAQTEQHVELAKLAQNVTEDVGDEGLSSTVKEVVDGQLLSASTRPQEMELISRYLDRKGVQPSQTEDKQWLNLIPTRNGGTVPMSVNDMSKLIAKRTIQYPIGKEFSTALGDFEKHGRQGGVWHPEDIKMQNMNLIKGNPDALASCLLDKGIFGTRPLIEKIQEVYFPDADVDLKELVYQSSQSKETYDEMVDMFAGGLERIAFERYSAGKAVHDKENSSDLDAQSLLDKYA